MHRLGYSCILLTHATRGSQEALGRVLYARAGWAATSQGTLQTTVSGILA